MPVSRRKFVTASLSLLAAGCATPPVRTGSRPGPIWPEPADRPRPGGAGSDSVAPVRRSRTPRPGAGSLEVIGRARWAGGNPIPSRLNRMNGVERITVHHEGWTPVDFVEAGATARRLESIRKSHLDRMHAGDIGYHYIIDRAGRIWAGRDVRYQGAHVRHHNPNNLGIMLLGNFNRQRPTSRQLGALESMLGNLMRRHRVAMSRLHTHRELNPTSCPGDHLQPRVDRYRSTGRTA